MWTDHYSVAGERSTQTPPLLEAAARLAAFGAWECDLATGRLAWTRGVFDIFDLPPDAPLHRSAIVDLYVDDWRRDMEQARGEVIRSGQSISLDSRIRTARGNTKWIRLSIDVVHQDGRPMRLFGAKQDITRHKDDLERLRHMAERDTLTGLLNRGMFEAQYRAVTRDSLDGGSFEVFVLVDLDLFKQINDQFGHAAGDECLRQVGARLLRVLGDKASLFRIGGDEFAVFLRAPMSDATTAKVLARTSRALSKPVMWKGVRIEIAVSMGAATVRRSGRRKASQLFAEADAALYRAKALGGSGVRMFSDAPDIGAERGDRSIGRRAADPAGDRSGARMLRSA